MYRRTKDQLARDRAIVAEMYCQGRLLYQIADQLNARDGVEYEVSVATVSRDLNIVRDEWKERGLRAVDEMRSEELAKIDQLEQEYWTAWKRSVGVSEKRKRRAVKREGKRAGAKADEELVVTETDQVGDPRFLKGVESCIERRCKILGIDAPQEIDMTVRSREQMEKDRENLEDLSPMEIADLYSSTLHGNA